MKALFERYLNEILGLAIMALMALALIAAQADAGIHEKAVQDLQEVVRTELVISDGS